MNSNSSQTHHGAAGASARTAGNSGVRSLWEHMNYLSAVLLSLSLAA